MLKNDHRSDMTGLWFFTELIVRDPPHSQDSNEVLIVWAW